MNKKFVFILSLILVSFGVEATKMTKNELKKYDYKIGIDLKECGIELYINDVKLISNGSMHNFNTTFGIGSFLKRENNKLRFVIFSLNNDSTKFLMGSTCKFDFLSRNRFESEQLEKFSYINYVPNNIISFNISQANNYQNLNAYWGKLLQDSKIEFVDRKNKYYRMTQKLNVKDDFPEWKWVNSFQFDSNIKYLNELSHEQQVKLKEVYTNLWSAINEQDDTKLKVLYSEMLEESSAADGGSVDSYYNSFGFSRLFDKEEFELQPLRISATSKISKYLDNRVISVFDSPVYFKHLESGQSIGINPKLRFDGDKFIITR